MTIYDPDNVRKANAERDIASMRRAFRWVPYSLLATIGACVGAYYMPEPFLFFVAAFLVLSHLVLGPLLLIGWTGSCGCGHPSCDTCWYSSRGEK